MEIIQERLGEFSARQWCAPCPRRWYQESVFHCSESGIQASCRSPKFDDCPILQFETPFLPCFPILPVQVVTMRTGFKQLARCLAVLTSRWTAGSCHEHSLDTHYRRPFSVEGWVDQTWAHRGFVESDDAPAVRVDQRNVSYSVIVLSPSTKPSNQFLDRERVRFFSPFPRGSGVVSVQFVDLPTRWEPRMRDSPIHVRHPDGVDKRVRMVFLRRELGSWPAPQVGN